MSTSRQRLPSEATTIGDTEEYAHLQTVVATLCKRDFSPGGQESVWAKILRTKINEISIHIPSDRAVSQHTRASFKSATETLLLILQFIQCSAYTIDNLKEASVEVTNFNATMIRLLGEPAVAPNDTEDGTKPTELSPQRQYFYQSLWDQSSKLFNSLIQHLQPCKETKDKHRAMLHLTQHRFSAAEADVRNNENDRGFCMLLASCPDQKTWQHTQWVFAEQGYLIDPQANQSIQNLCLHAQGAYSAGEYLAIKVADSGFSDVSVTLLDQRPPPPSTAPTKSLLELSGDGVLKPGGNFSPEHKTVLAWALSHALLCLHNKSAGPWLQAFWNLRNVFFLQESNGDMVYDIHHPYISCELAHVPAPSDIKKFLDRGRDHGFLFIQAFGKLLLELARGDEVKTLLGPREVNIYNLKDLNDEDAPEGLGESYREAVRSCLMFPKIWNEEQMQSAGVSAQDVIFRRIVEPLRKAVDALGPEAWRPANLDLKAGAIRLGKLATSVPRPSTVSAMGLIENAATGPHLTNAQSSRGRQTHSVRPQTSLDNSRARFNAHSSFAATSGAPRAARRGTRQPTAQTQRVSTSQPPGCSASRSGVPRGHGNLAGRISRLAKAPRARDDPCSTRLSVQGIEGHANASLSPGTPGQPAAKPSIHFGFGRCFTSQIPNESSRSIQELEHTIKERFQPGATDERIRIAVLDTGMDDGEYAKNENEELKKPPWKRVVARSNFCIPKEEDPNANTHDLDGHGTKVASIILCLAENIDLLIARVCRGTDVEEADRDKETEFKDPEPAVVARAINWAVEQKVHVINLSLGYRDEQEHPGISDLRTALERAVKEQILVFAATSNEGLTADVAWPAKNLTYAIGIHSSTDKGRPSEFIGKASNEANLMVVGERILSYGRRGEPQLCSGTSFATPVAAAVGAMILAFVGQEACEEQVQNLESAHKGWDWKAVLRTNRGMRNVLEKISEAVPNEGGTYYRISEKLLWEEFHLQDGREHALNIIAGALRR